MGIISFDSVTKGYGDNLPVISELTLDIHKGAFAVLVGPSGCGKTTLLKLINKLITPTAGDIRVNGKSLTSWNTIELRRAIGYVIQQIGLFPHMTIADNMTYVLKITKAVPEARRARAEELIELVGMDKSYLSRYPHQLSGGQQQRVGVARALAADPDIILMDEPFGAVDEVARRHLQDELKRIHEKLQKTIVFVTHDIQEALKLGTVIILLKDGHIEQMGTRDELIFQPETPFVKSFFGLKGFRATLDESVLSRAYEDILSGKKNAGDILSNLCDG